MDHHPKRPGQYTTDNVILNNWITATGRELVDTAAIYIGFTRNTLVAHNTISDTPWSGIALGWGWGLYDVGSFPGLPGGTSGMWGNYTTPTVNSGNRILRNHISRFLQDRWDGGAVYCNGQQGQSMDDPLLIEGNVVCHKRKEGGGNMFYPDGGSRYVVLRNNASFDNPIGRVDLGPPPQTGDPLPYPAAPSADNAVPYGGEIGGCRTYGDLHFEGNYWRAGLIPLEQAALGVLYSPEGFFNVCPYTSGGVAYPTNLTFAGNHDIPLGEIEVPQEILGNAGIRPTSGSVWLELPGSASFPPHNPGPSWNVPRVSLPVQCGIRISSCPRCPRWSREGNVAFREGIDAIGRRKRCLPRGDQCHRSKETLPSARGSTPSVDGNVAIHRGDRCHRSTGTLPSTEGINAIGRWERCHPPRGPLPSVDGNVAIHRGDRCHRSKGTLPSTEGTVAIGRWERCPPPRDRCHRSMGTLPSATGSLPSVEGNVAFREGKRTMNDEG